MCKYTTPCKYTPAQTRCCFYMYFILYVFFIYRYFWSCECAANIHTYANFFLLFQVKLAVKIKNFVLKSKNTLIIRFLGQTWHLESSFTHI